MKGRWRAVLFWAAHIGAFLLAAPLAVGGLLAAAMLAALVLSLGGPL